MNGFGDMIQRLKENPKTIVFPEGSDPRILEAASRLLASSFLKPILLGNEEEIIKSAEEAGYNIRGAKIIDPENYDKFDEMVEAFCELRKRLCGVSLLNMLSHCLPSYLLRNHYSTKHRGCLSVSTAINIFLV